MFCFSISNTMLSTLDNAIDFAMEVLHFWFLMLIPYLLYKKAGNTERQNCSLQLLNNKASLLLLI